MSSILSDSWGHCCLKSQCPHSIWSVARVVSSHTCSTAALSWIMNGWVWIGMRHSRHWGYTSELVSPISQVGVWPWVSWCLQKWVSLTGVLSLYRGPWEAPSAGIETTPVFSEDRSLLKPQVFCSSGLRTSPLYHQWVPWHSHLLDPPSINADRFLLSSDPLGWGTICLSPVSYIPSPRGAVQVASQ